MNSWRRTVLGLAALGLLGLGGAALGLGCQSGFRWSASAAPQGEDGAAAVVCFGQVDLAHGCAALAPLHPGRVADVLVEEGAHVEANAPLLRLETGMAGARADEARAALAAAQAQLAQTRQARERHPIGLDLQRLAIEAATARLAAVRHLLARKQELEKRDLISRREVAASEEQIKELTAALAAEQKKLHDLEAQDPGPAIQRLEAEVDVLQARLRQAVRAVAEMTVRAPRAGVVLRVLVGPGDVLSTAQARPVVLFAANEPRIVRAEVEQEFSSRVAVGQVVQLLEDATSRPLGSGTVIRLSDWYLPRRNILPEPTRFNDTRTLECIIEPHAGTPSLRLGQRVRVVIGPSP